MTVIEPSTITIVFHSGEGWMGEVARLADRRDFDPPGATGTV